MNEKLFKLIPDSFCSPAGQPVCFTIRYIHQGPALQTGASIRFGYNRQDGAGRCQTDNPSKPNYLHIESMGDAQLKLIIGGGRRSITFYKGTGVSDLFVFEIKVVAESIQTGDKVDIIFGADNEPYSGFIVGTGCDTPWGLFYHIDPENRYPLKAHNPACPHYQEYISADGKEVPDWKSCDITVSITPQQACYADLSLPSLVSTGKETHLRVVVYDRFFNHLKDYKSDLHLRSENISGLCMDKTKFCTGSNGFALIPLVFEKPLSAVSLEFFVGDLGIFSTNPIQVTKEAHKKLLWGDLHGHSSLSDGGRRGPDDFFTYAREIRGLEFAALADHSFGLAVKGHWQQLVQSIKDQSQNGEFIALLGCELMPPAPYGHRNVYFPGTEAVIIMADYQVGAGGSFIGEQVPAYEQIWDPKTQKIPTITETLAALKDEEFLWTVHHCGDFAPEEREYISLYEACSVWGISEECFRKNRNTTTLKDLFSQGYSPGLTGSSDDHRAKAGFMSSVHVDGALTPWPSGLTAVVCDSITRSEIYNALKAKRCYATTGARILIDPDVVLEDPGLTVRLQIAGTAQLDCVWVFKNGKEVFSEFIYTGNSGELIWKDNEFTEKENCYIRIHQADGHVAWINPLPFAER